MPLGVRVLYEVGWVPSGSSPAIIMQQQAAEPGQGPTMQAHAGFIAQVRLYRDFEPVPIAVGSEGTVTVANIKSAFDAASTAVTTATGPGTLTTELPIIQGWASGGT